MRARCVPPVPAPVRINPLRIRKQDCSPGALRPKKDRRSPETKLESRISRNRRKKAYGTQGARAKRVAPKIKVVELFSVQKRKKARFLPGGLALGFGANA